MNLANALWRQGLSEPERPAIFYGTQHWATYGQWATRSATLAVHLLRIGLKAGDRVMIFMSNHPRYLEILWGCWWAGLVVVPVNAKLHPEEAAWIASDSGAQLVFVNGEDGHDDFGSLGKTARLVDISHDDTAAVFEPEQALSALPPPAVSAQDALAWLFYTSGTTGKPKGVMLTTRSLMTVGMTYSVDVDSASRDDAMLYAAPMSHGCGIYAIPHQMVGARHIVPKSRGVNAKEMFELGTELGPLSTFAAPTIVKRLVDYCEQMGLTHEDVAASFKTIVYGGAPMYLADIRKALATMGPRFVQIYGQGESPMTVTVLSKHHIANTQHPRYLERLASVGVPQTPVQVRVVDEENRPLPPGEIGEVVVKGDPVMLGYWNQPEATAHTLVDGWLKTGDLGCFDEDGFLTLKERSKDVIISGGTNIYPREVEEALLTHSGLAEVSVVGAPDPEWGEIVVACVVPAPGHTLTADELDAHCLAHIARFKRPRKYIFKDSLPKNHYGKVLKTQLSQELRDTHPKPSSAKP